MTSFNSPFVLFCFVLLSWLGWVEILYLFTFLMFEEKGRSQVKLSFKFQGNSHACASRKEYFSEVELNFNRKKMNVPE